MGHANNLSIHTNNYSWIFIYNQIIHIYIYTWLIREAIIHIFIPTMKPAHSNHHGHAFHALFVLVEAFLNGGLLGKSSETWWCSKIATFDYQSEEIPYNILKQQPCYLLVICYIAIENPPILQLGESNRNGTCNQ